MSAKISHQNEDFKKALGTLPLSDQFHAICMSCSKTFVICFVFQW